MGTDWVHLVDASNSTRNMFLLKYLKNVYLDASYLEVLLDFSLTVKVATLKFISGRYSAISSAKEGKSGFICNLVKS